MFNTIQNSGSPIQAGPGMSSLITNRTGAASVKGGTVFLDLPQADGDSTSLTEALKNGVAASTALMAVGLLGLWTTASIADNANGQAIFGEGVIAYANVDGTTDVAKGDALKCVNAGDHMVKATTGTDRYHAIALEARSTNSEGAIKVLLFSSGKF